MITRMSEKKKDELKRLLNAMNTLDDAGSERITTLAEGMAIQKSLATNEKKEGEYGDQN